MLPAQVLISPGRGHRSAQLPLTPYVSDPKAQTHIRQGILVAAKIYPSYTADITQKIISRNENKKASQVCSSTSL